MRHTTFFLLAIVSGCSEYDVSAIPPQALAAMDTGLPETATDQPPVEEEEDCVESSTAFDIEEVSTLQDAFGLPQVRDGLTLAVDGSNIDQGRSWRPVSVQILVMFPTWYFDFYDDSNALTVDFYPSSSPTGTSPISKTIQIRKADLNWDALLLPANADWSGDDRNQMAAWLEFDLRDLAPAEGYISPDYFVSLGWDSIGFPNVGYSNFELSCPQNWTDYGTGSYVQNSGQDCSWPMMKIEIETLAPGDCE
jgi:hypothetical protein